VIGTLAVVAIRRLRRKRLQWAIDRALSDAMQQAGALNATRTTLRRIK
jgi:hypothetical protein